MNTFVAVHFMRPRQQAHLGFDIFVIDQSQVQSRVTNSLFMSDVRFLNPYHYDFTYMIIR
jgi:hypothetical protein